MKNLLNFALIGPALGLFYLVAFPIYALLQFAKFVLPVGKPARR
jgi:hypothetical protein